MTLQTDRQTHRPNPRCACAPRVNKKCRYISIFLQLTHTDWEEDPDGMFYSTYIHVVLDKDGEDPITLTEGQFVSKGDLIAYSNRTATLEHIHFEVRDGSLFSRDACNPWKYLPNIDNDYSSFEALLTLTQNSGGTECQAVVNVSVPPDQLTFNRVELHILDSSDTPQKVRFYDFCGTNRNRTQEQVDNSSYLEDPNDESSYLIHISPMFFNSQSFSKNENASWGFEFVDLPSLPGGGRVMAKIFDVFDNSLSTDYVSYNCTGGGMTEEEGGDSSGMEPTGDDMEPTNDMEPTGDMEHSGTSTTSVTISWTVATLSVSMAWSSLVGF